MEKTFEKEASRYEEDIGKYVRAQKGAAKGEAVLDVFVKDALQQSRYSPGIQPFAWASERAELDEALSRGKGAIAALQLTSEKEISQRDAQNKIRWRAAN